LLLFSIKYCPSSSEWEAFDFAMWPDGSRFCRDPDQNCNC
jgi:hypothetical protein